MPGRSRQPTSSRKIEQYRRYEVDLPGPQIAARGNVPLCMIARKRFARKRSVRIGLNPTFLCEVIVERGS